jgi:uncharacterized cysteine cluster protein YcgN (CxxCxxCC family)
MQKRGTKKREIYRGWETVTDKCGRCCNAIESIIKKYA